jgi:hypothetical protein
MTIVCDESPVAPRTHKKNPWIEIDVRAEIDGGDDDDDNDDGSGDGE